MPLCCSKNINADDEFEMLFQHDADKLKRNVNYKLLCN